jgi:hypothetical protein
MNDDLNRLEGKIDAMHEQIAALRVDFSAVKAIVNGGPGESFACKVHQTNVANLSAQVEGLKSQMLKYAGGLSAIVFMLSTIGPIVIKHIFP